MKLTGKCKEDFGTLLKNTTESNAYIISWFDTKGIYISIEVEYDKMLQYNRGFTAIVYKEGWGFVYADVLRDDVYETRLEATNAAILKANELYNELQ